MTVQNLIKPLDERYQSYLTDESRLIGEADSISFPSSISEAAQIIKHLQDSSTAITVQGGQTGICGGAVPTNGHLMNLSNLNNITEPNTDNSTITVIAEAGATLDQLEQKLSRHNLIWPPNSSEKTATIGGVIATDARGLDADFYGSNNNYIHGLYWLNDHGELLYASKETQTIKVLDVENFEEVLDEFNQGEFGLSTNENIVDVLLGSEGIFGIITACEIKVISSPKIHWGICFFFDDQEALLKFAEELRHLKLTQKNAYLTVAEFIDELTISYINEVKEIDTELQSLPDLGENTAGIIYLELQGNDEEEVEEIAEILMNLAIEHECDIDNTWAVSESKEIQKIKKLRHAAPEAVNTVIASKNNCDSRITKLSTDMSVEEKTLGQLVVDYKRDLNDLDLKGTVFGHIFSNRLHVNIISENFQDYIKGKELIDNWAQKNQNKGGDKVFNEHGIGKLKKETFKKVVDKNKLEKLQKLKTKLDPNNFWNPDNML